MKPYVSYKLYQRDYQRYYQPPRLESESSTAVFADSFMLPARVYGERVTGSWNKMTYDLRPHVYVDGGKYMRTSLVNNYAVGGATFEKVLNGERNIAHWANNIPSVTVLHLGACDIANSDLGIADSTRKELHKVYIAFLEELQVKARALASDKQKFDDRMRQHRYLVVTIPQWQGFGKLPKGHEWEEKVLQKKVRKANEGLKNRNSHEMYTKFKAVVFAPRLDKPTWRGIHLSEASQEIYNAQIFDAAAHLVCTFCRPGEELDKNAIKKENILSNHCRRLGRAPVVAPQ